MYISTNKQSFIMAKTTYQIILVDKITKETEKVENFKPNKDPERELKLRLLELQQQYCEDEQPTVSQQRIKSGAVYFDAIVAESDCDFIHISILKKAS